MAPKLEKVFDFRGYIAVGGELLTEIPVKGGAQRMIVQAKGGYIRGVGPATGFNAEMKPFSADYILLDPTTGTAHLNVRVIAATPSGDTLYFHYPGILKMNEAVGKIIAARPDAKATNYGDTEWFTTPVIETSSKEFKWLESSVLVGQGHWHIDEQGTAAEYEIFRLVN
ncbi:hypothetical protein RBB50_007507 [Rhinocladiella similis]